MKVIEEIKDGIPRQDEIVEYERKTKTNIQQCYERLTKWFIHTNYIVGRGGNHVYVSNHNAERILLITE